MPLTSHIILSNGYDQRFRKLKPKPKLNPPNAHRSQIKICENRQTTETQNVQFRLMPNAFRILKPIQKSSKRVWPMKINVICTVCILLLRLNLCGKFRAIGPLFMEILHLNIWGIQVSSANAVWVLI